MVKVTRDRKAKYQNPRLKAATDPIQIAIANLIAFSQERGEGNQTGGSILAITMIKLISSAVIKSNNIGNLNYILFLVFPNPYRLNVNARVRG